MKKPFYKKKWFIAFIVICILGALIDQDEEKKKDIQSDETSVENVEETKTEIKALENKVTQTRSKRTFNTTNSKDSKSTNEIRYADDDVVNDFITRYNKITEYPFKDIRKGNISTKYFAISDGYYFELLNAADTNKMHIVINNKYGTKDKSMKGMKNVFHDAIKVLDEDSSEKKINSFFDELTSNKHKQEVKFENVDIIYVKDFEGRAGHIVISDN